MRSTAPRNTARHNVILNSLGSALHPQLEGRCQYFTIDLRVPATGLHTYPDLMVICGEIEYSGNRQAIVTNPRFIAEVDRGGKFVHYRSMPGLADYMIAAQDSARVEHWSRQPDSSWLLREFTSLTDAIRIASINAEVGLAAIYEDVSF